MITHLKGWPKEYITVFIAMLPVAELRGSIPVGLAMGLAPLKVLWLSLIGNILPIVPILIFLEPVTNTLRRIPLLKRFFDWFYERTRRKAAVVEKYELFGLMIFVAIPLPATGAWTGCIAASLFKIRFRIAFVSISLGVVIAGIIVLLTCLFGSSLLKTIFLNRV